MLKKNAPVLDVVLLGNVEWSQARAAAFDLLQKLSGEIVDLNKLAATKDAYSPVAWMNICRQLQIVTDGMIVMRMLTAGKSPNEIALETGIAHGSISAYKAWNTMYTRALRANAERRVAVKGHTKAEREADIAFLRSCGIALDVRENGVIL